MKRRRFLTSIAGLVFAAWITTVPSPAVQRGEHSRKRPNIVFIMTDDQDIGTLQFMPRLDGLLAAQGVTFTNMFVTTPQCCPSHVSVLTGLYPHNSGVLNNWYPTGGFQRFFELGGENSTVATWLQAAGYRTARFGKYLTEYDATTYVPPGWSEWYAFYGSGKYFNYTLNENGAQVVYGADPGDYSVDVLTQKVIDFIDRAEDEPFLRFLRACGSSRRQCPEWPRHPGTAPQGKSRISLKELREAATIPSLVDLLNKREKELKVVENRLIPRQSPDRQKLESALLQRVAEWRIILRSNPAQGRMVLRQLVGEIEVLPNADRPEWCAIPQPAGLLVGMVHVLASPSGVAPFSIVGSVMRRAA